MKKAILKQEVERTFGRQLTETRDFEVLSQLLLSHTRALFLQPFQQPPSPIAFCTYQ